MGGCAGKFKLKKSKTDDSKKKSKKKSESQTTDKSSVKTEAPKSSTLPIPEQTLKVPNDPKLEPQNDNKPVDTATGVDLNIQIQIDEHKQTNETLSTQTKPNVVSIADSEGGTELAKLVYGNPEKDYAENPPLASTAKSTAV